MRRREAKKEQILEAGVDVMRRQGYHGTSVKDIVDAAGVPKGSFYNYFDSKEMFAVQALEAATAPSHQQMRSRLRDASRPPLERLGGFFAEQTENWCHEGFSVGCFIGNLCQEMADDSELIRHKVRLLLQDNTRLIEETLREAQQEGALHEEADPAQLAHFLFNAWEGALLRMKATKSREPLDAFVALLPAILKH